MLHAPGHSFSDVARKVVSIINLASVAALENAAGAPVHPLRFRGNLYVEGWPAWHEFELLDREIAIGPSARLKVVKRIVRCAATEVDPDTGIRDLSNAMPRHARPMIDKSVARCDMPTCGVYRPRSIAGAARSRRSITMSLIAIASSRTHRVTIWRALRSTVRPEDDARLRCGESTCAPLDSSSSSCRDALAQAARRA